MNPKEFPTKYDYVPTNFDINMFQTEKTLRGLEVLILQVSRGKKTQLQMSRLLKQKFNIYGKWESGSKIVMWEDLIEILKIKKISLIEIIEDCYKIYHNTGHSSASAIMTHFLDLFFFRDLNLFSAYLNISEIKARRLIKEESAVPADIILKLLVYRPQHFILFLEQLHLTDAIPELKLEMDRMKSIAHSQVIAPANSAVLYFLDTTEYQKLKAHDIHLISKRLQLTHRQVESAVKTLLSDGAIEYDGTKYLLKSRSFDFPSSDFRKTIPMFTYWLYRCICSLNEKLRTNNAKTEIPNAHSFQICAVSKKTAFKITEKIRQTHHEIMQMIKDGDSNDVVVRAFVLSHFGLEESPPMKMFSDEDMGFIVKPGESRI